MPMDEFVTYYNVRTNSLEYNIITTKINKILEWKEIPVYSEPHPRNSAHNVLLNLNIKGSSKLYTRMKDSHYYVIYNIADKWREDCDIDLSTISISRSFLKHHLKYKVTYLNYIQFQNLE